MQGIHLITNAPPAQEDGQPMTSAGHVLLNQVTVVDGSTQSNAIDCGCHASMALRWMAAAVLNGGSWLDEAMPPDASVQRDASWRKRIGRECLTV